ncbi:putative leucine-rich repeat domain superfamily [Helianthus anomalus]
MGVTVDGLSRCSELSVLKLGICLNMTDEGLIFYGNGCKKLIELDLYRCTGLEMINGSYCRMPSNYIFRAIIHCGQFVSRVWCIKIVSPQEVQQLRKQGVKVLNPVQIQKPSDSCYTPNQQESMNLRNGVTSVGSLEY